MSKISPEQSAQSAVKDISLEDFIRSVTRGLQTEQTTVAEAQTDKQPGFIIGCFPYPPDGPPAPAPYSGDGGNPKPEAESLKVSSPILHPVKIGRIVKGQEAPRELARQGIITQNDAEILLRLLHAREEGTVTAAATEVTSAVAKQILEAIIDTAQTAFTQQSDTSVPYSSGSTTKKEVEWDEVAQSAFEGAVAGFALGQRQAQ